MGGFNAEPTDTTFSDFCERMIFDLVKDETCFKIPNFGNWRKWLDIIFGYKISRENNKFVTSIYRKLTFSGVFTYFERIYYEIIYYAPVTGIFIGKLKF